MNATQETTPGEAEAELNEPSCVQIRAYVPADYPEMYAVWNEAELYPFTEQQVARLVSSGGGALVAEAILPTGEKPVVGTLLWSHNGHSALLWKLAVQSGFRNRGIARRLLRQAEQDIVAAGLMGVGLLTRDTNTVAQSLYSREGWKQNPHQQFWGKRLVANPAEPVKGKEQAEC